MKAKYFLIFGLLIMFASCSEEKRKIQREKKNYQPFIFTMTHSFSKNELNMSFPIWFSDTLIRRNSIRHIKRSLYASSVEDDKMGIEPKEVYHYEFENDGSVKKVEIENFYENVRIGAVSFQYMSKKDENGFASVKMKFEQKEDNSESPYLIYDKEPSGTKFLVYRNQNSGDYLFYMLNKKNWGVLSVDSILSPTPYDIVNLGSPKQPIKTYQVVNTVKQEHVVEYNYDKRTNHLMSVHFEKFPFQYKRSIQYNKQGGCIGFIDSTFSQGTYLNRKESKFEFENDLPVSLIKKNESINAASRYFQLEHFEYSFFDER